MAHKWDVFHWLWWSPLRHLPRVEGCIAPPDPSPLALAAYSGQRAPCGPALAIMAWADAGGDPLAKTVLLIMGQLVPWFRNLLVSA